MNPTNGCPPQDPSYTKSLLASIMDEVDEEVLLLTPDGGIVEANRAVWENRGLTREEVLGRTCPDLDGAECCGPDPDGDPCPFHHTLKTGQKAERLNTLMDGQGRVRYLRVSTYPVFGPDKVLTHVVEMRRDITNRTHLEQRLQQSERLAAIGELSTYIAHEIRNPLFAIAGFANALVRNESLDDSAREKVTIILEESRRLDGILKATMNFARPTEAKEQRVDVNEVAKRTMELLSIGFGKMNIRLHMELEEPIAMARFDPELLKQCLINLVKNAQEAMAEGGVLFVRTAMKNGRVMVEVEDTGAGIPEEIRDKVFNPFFSTKDKGAGLGLAMTKKILEEAGGSVELNSQTGKCTRVTLYLLPLLAVDG